MAIFASTTTSGYSDPLKAMNIKALEQRLKDQQAQMAAQQPDAASMATIPGGIGHVLGVVGDRMAQSRNEQAIAAQKDELAKLIAADPTGENPQTQARMAVIAPDMYKDIVQQIAERRRQQDLFAQQDKARTEQARLDEIARQQGYTHTDAAAAQKVLDEQVKTAEANKQAEIVRGQEDTAIRARDAQKVLDAEVAAAAQENRLQSRPTDLDVVKADRALARGEIDQATRDAIVGKATAPSASEMKAGTELQNTHLETQGALSDLKEARDLLGPEGAGIRAGAGAGYTQTGAKWVGDTLGLSDPELTRKTERYNQIMSAEAITAMAAKLKGASTDYEMKAFVALMNDPNADPKNKVTALNKMIAKAEAHLVLQQDQMKRAKVSAPAGAGGAATADPLEGRTANGPNGPLIRRNGAWVPNG